MQCTRGLHDSHRVLKGGQITNEVGGPVVLNEPVGQFSQICARQLVVTGLGS